MKVHGKERRRRRLRTRERVLNVAITDLLAACREGPAGVEEWAPREGGMTLTSAPVSTRNLKPLAWSVTKNRRLHGRPAVLAAISTGPGRFPTRNMGGCIYGLFSGSGDGTSTNRRWSCMRGWWLEIGNGNIGWYDQILKGGLLPVKQKQGRVGVPPLPAVELLRR